MPDPPPSEVVHSNGRVALLWHGNSRLPRNQPSRKKGRLFTVLLCIFGMIVTMQFLHLMVLETEIRHATQQSLKIPPTLPKKYISPNKKLPLFALDPIFKAEIDRIDSISAEERCNSFGLQVLNPRDKESHQRKIFWGTMVANENWDVLEMNAVELYNLLDVAVFVESNTTQTATPRQLRFHSEQSEDRQKLLYTNLFGNITRVMIGHWLHNMPDLKYLDREASQRDTIVELWTQAGMQPTDVGIVVDADEIVSRDFLLAVKQCDFPQFHLGQSCRTPKVLASAKDFESSPFCIKHEAWHRIALLLGECVDGVGDPSGRVVPRRNYKNIIGERSHKWGRYSHQSYPDDVIESSRYPLWSANDIRIVDGARDGLTNYAPSFLKRNSHPEQAMFSTGYHMHNWFTDIHSVREKYLTYGHPNPEAMKKKLGEMGNDLIVVVRCIHELGNGPKGYLPDKQHYYENGAGLGGNLPIYFQNQTYVEFRHAQVKQMVLEDEIKYGPTYTSVKKLE